MASFPARQCHLAVKAKLHVVSVIPQTSLDGAAGAPPPQTQKTKIGFNGSDLNFLQTGWKIRRSFHSLRLPAAAADRAHQHKCAICDKTLPFVACLIENDEKRKSTVFRGKGAMGNSLKEREKTGKLDVPVKKGCKY